MIVACASAAPVPTIADHLALVEMPGSQCHDGLAHDGVYQVYECLSRYTPSIEKVTRGEDAAPCTSSLALIGGAFVFAGFLSAGCERAKRQQMVAPVAAGPRTTSREVKRRVYKEAKAYAEYHRSGAVTPVPAPKTPAVLDNKLLAKLGKLLMASRARCVVSCADPEFRWFHRKLFRSLSNRQTILSFQGVDRRALAGRDADHQAFSAASRATASSHLWPGATGAG